MQFVENRAAVNAPQSRRFAWLDDARPSRQRLECDGFSIAFGDEFKAKTQRSQGAKENRLPCVLASLRLGVVALKFRPLTSDGAAKRLGSPKFDVGRSENG